MTIFFYSGGAFASMSREDVELFCIDNQVGMCHVTTDMKYECCRAYSYEL